jgi:hypothetical protein
MTHQALALFHFRSFPFRVSHARTHALLALSFSAPLLLLLLPLRTGVASL